MPARIPLVFSVDVEEDNWQPLRNGLTLENLRQLPRLAAHFERLGIRATYCATYQVVCQPWAAGVLKDISAGGRGEIAAHLHPWNTPPYDGAPRRGATMLRNYRLETQEAKIRTVTEAIATGIGARPSSFRAGRFGLGPQTVTALIRTGYRADSSVTPFISWKTFDEGPDFLGASPSVYRLDGQGDVTVPVAEGGVVEVPISAGYTRLSLQRWPAVERLARRPAVRALRLPGIAARTGLARRSVVSPEIASVRDMLAISRRLLEGGVSHLNAMLHSSSLMPGLTPFVATAADVSRLYDRITSYLDGLAGLCEVEFKTVGEVAAAADAPPSQRDR